MKKTIQPFSAVVLVLMFLNLNASAQYRTETTFRDQFNGSSFTNKLDSIQYYFSGSNNWKSANDGIDLAESICKGFLYFYGSETPIPKYPDVPNLNPYASVDSFYTYSSYPGSSHFDKLVSKTIVYRDALGDASSNVKMTLDSSGAFVNSERDTFVYSAHKITQKITQKWVSGAWVNQTKFSLNYNAAGQIVEYIFAYWKSGAWENQRQYLYSYDASGNCVLFEDNVDSSGTFVYGYRTYLTYDASNRLIELFYKENTLIGTWKNVHKFTYTYTPSGEPSVVNKFWYINDSTFYNVEKRSYTYTVAKLTGYLLDLLTPSHYNNTKNTYSYNAAGKLIEMLSQKWDTSSTSWVNATKFSVNYDANNNIDNFYLEFWNKSSSAWLGDTASYKSKYNFRYASYSSSIASVNNNSALIQVYPNPANEELKIKISGSKLQNATVTLYDMMGKVLNRQEIILPQFQELSMNTANLASGAYIISLVTAQDKLTQLVQIK